VLKIIGFISAGFLGVSGLIGLFLIIVNFEYMETLYVLFDIIYFIANIMLAVFIGMLAHKLK
jgi:hypothetical protein